LAISIVTNQTHPRGEEIEPIGKGEGKYKKQWEIRQSNQYIKNEGGLPIESFKSLFVCKVKCILACTNMGLMLPNMSL